MRTTTLKDTLNAWLAGARVQRKRNYLARKYFDSPKQQHDRAMSDYSLAGGRISLTTRPSSKGRAPGLGLALSQR